MTIVVLIFALIGVIFTCAVIAALLWPKKKYNEATTQGVWDSPLKGEVPRDCLPNAYPLDKGVRNRHQVTRGGLPIPKAWHFDQLPATIQTRQDEQNYLDRLIKSHGQEEGYRQFMDHRNEVIERRRKEEDHALLVKALYDPIDRDNVTHKQLRENSDA